MAQNRYGSHHNYATAHLRGPHPHDRHRHNVDASIPHWNAPPRHVSPPLERQLVDFPRLNGGAGGYNGLRDFHPQLNPYAMVEREPMWHSPPPPAPPPPAPPPPLEEMLVGVDGLTGGARIQDHDQRAKSWMIGAAAFDAAAVDQQLNEYMQDLRHDNAIHAKNLPDQIEAINRGISLSPPRAPSPPRQQRMDPAQFPYADEMQIAQPKTAQSSEDAGDYEEEDSDSVLQPQSLTESFVDEPEERPVSTELEAYLRGVFHGADLNNDGVLSVAEAAALLSRSGLDLTSEQIMELRQLADTDDDGVLSCSEFLELGAAMVESVLPEDQREAASAQQQQVPDIDIDIEDDESEDAEDEELTELEHRLAQNRIKQEQLKMQEQDLEREWAAQLMQPTTPASNASASPARSPGWATRAAGSSVQQASQSPQTNKADEVYQAAGSNMIHSRPSGQSAKKHFDSSSHDAIDLISPQSESQKPKKLTAAVTELETKLWQRFGTMREAFLYMDRDRNGAVDKAEFGAMLREYYLSDDAADEIIAAFGGSNQVEAADFYKLFA